MDKSAVVEVEEVVEGKVDWKGRPVTIGSHGGHYNSLLVLALFAFENLATTAPAVNLITYFNGLMHYDIADASNQLTNFMGVCYILSILIAYVADSHIGRCKVIVISVFVEFLGFAMLTVQAHIPHLKPPPCNIFDPTSHCERVGGRNALFLFFSLYLVALGAAGIKAGVPPHGADQFDEKNEQEALQRSSYFNWVLLSVCIGAALSLVFVVYIQSDVGWDWGFGVSSVAIFLGGLIFIAGIPRYRMHVVQATNPITELLQVYVASFQNRKFHHPGNSEELYETVKDKESATEVEFLPHRDIFRSRH
ncbi:Nitrate transporter 1.2 [Acorus calamus]|uniref:Nitrate transporter 1.2 n=1 Tax=Acorus calamus TaxID=4465 RepID=A0AAV9CBG7_ACOCL|nr:Nitrate transporter 1.2 [Acorus calamus]